MTFDIAFNNFFLIFPVENEVLEGFLSTNKYSYFLLKPYHHFAITLRRVINIAIFEQLNLFVMMFLAQCFGQHLFSLFLIYNS